MPASTQTWRAKCGHFTLIFQQFMQKRVKAQNKTHYALTVRWPLNLVRTVIIGVMLTMVCANSTACTVTQLSSLQSRPSPDAFLCGSSYDVFQSFLMLAIARYNYIPRHEAMKCSYLFTVSVPRKKGLVHTTLICMHVFIAGLLLMCGDVEANPGPQFHAHSQDMNFDSRSCPHWPEGEKDSQVYPPHGDSYPDQMGDLQSDIPDRFNFLCAWCHSNQAESKQLKEDVHYLSSKCESLEQQCAKLEEWQRYLYDMTNHLHDHQDQMERVTRQNNLRLFNVHEAPGEDSRSCVRTVVQLLTRFYPIKSWTERDVIRAHRVGKPNRDGRPRTILVQLGTWSDKLSILEEKTHRKEMADCLGVRVAGDLTIRQQSEKKRHSNNGRVAYFRSGRMHFRQGRLSPRQQRAVSAGRKKSASTTDDQPATPTISNQRKSKTNAPPLPTPSPSMPHADHPPCWSSHLPPPSMSMIEYPMLMKSGVRSTTDGTPAVSRKKKSSISDRENEETAGKDMTTLTNNCQVPSPDTAEERQVPDKDQQRTEETGSTHPEERNRPHKTSKPCISTPPPFLVVTDGTAPPPNLPPSKHTVLVNPLDSKRRNRVETPMQDPKCGGCGKSLHTQSTSGEDGNDSAVVPSRTPAVTTLPPIMDTQGPVEEPHVPINDMNMCTPPVESLDDSETLLKQPFDPNSPVKDVENQTQGMAAESPLQHNTPFSVLVSTPATEQHIAIENEEVPQTQTPGVRLHTRSRARCRQLQITDSFSCTGVVKTPDPPDKHQQKEDLQGPKGSESCDPVDKANMTQPPRDVRGEGRVTNNPVDKPNKTRSTRAARGEGRASKVRNQKKKTAEQETNTKT